MGSIAIQGGPAARELFREVLIASASVDILVDRPMSPSPRLTSANTTSILLRSIDANMQQTLATHLDLASATARNFSMSLRVSGVPASCPFRGSFDFNVATVRPLFEFAYWCARKDRLWIADDHEHPAGRTVVPATSSPDERCAGAIGHN
jgi:hypothetical protein